MPLPSVFQGVQDCRLPAFRCSKRLRRPPRQQLLPAGLSKPSRRPPRQQLSALAICFSGGSRLPFARLQMLQTPPRASKATTLTAIHALAICFSGGSRLPFARLQTLPTLPQASKATTLTATCPCHLKATTLTAIHALPSVFRGFKTAVCPPSNAPNASAGFQGNSLQVNNSYSYMPLPSVFQGVLDCRLPAFKCSKRLRRPPRQQLLPAGLSKPSRRPPRQQLSALAICFSGGSRLPFARLQMLQTPPQASKATTLTAIQLQLYMPLPSVFQGVQDCRLPTFKCSKRLRLPAGLSKPSRRPPRQQLSALAICFSGGSRLPFARLQMVQTPPQASKATTLTAIQLQLYMPLPSVFQGVQDCRLRLQMFQMLPQASKATGLQVKSTTLTATCPRHLFFRGFKTAVCPPSNAPNASAGLQGNNSYLQASPNPPAGLQGNNSLPLPSVFQGVQDCRLPAFKCSKRLRRPPRQQLLQLYSYSYTCPCHLFFRGFKTAVCPPSNAPNAPAGLQGNNSYSYMPWPSQGNTSYSYTCSAICFSGVQDCRLPAFKRSKRFRRLPRQQPPSQQLLQLHALAICFSGGSRLPFARLQMLQTPPQASKATTLTCRPLQTLPQASKATTLCPCHLFFRGFKTAVCPPSNAPNSSAGLQGNNSYSYTATAIHALAICFSGGSRLPFARLQMLQTPPFTCRPLQTLPQASKATTVCPCHLFFRGFKTAVCPPSNAPNASAGLQGNNSYSYTATAIYTCPCHLFFRGFKTAVCPPSNAPNASAGLQGNNSYLHTSPNPPAGLQGNNSLPLPSVFQGVQDCRLPAFKCSKRLRRPPRQQLVQLYSYSYTCPCHLFFRGFKTAVCPPSNAPNAPAGLQGNNSYSYMPLPSQGNNSYSYTCSAICFSGGSRLPFARLQTLQTLPQASKATASKSTTLTATCPCHLFFRGFKTAVCPPSNAPNALRRPPRQQLLQLYSYSYTCPCHLFFRGFKTAVCPPSNAPKAPAGLQGNNSYSYMPLPSQGNNSYSYTCSAICFSGGSRLPFARLQTLQTLPQASKATASKSTTLTATCPCHLFFRGFKTCPPSNAPNASAGLQGNNSYLQASPNPRRPPRQQLSALAICFSGGSRLPFARLQMLQTPPQASKATTLTAIQLQLYMPFPSVFQGVQDCRLPASKRLRLPAGLSKPSRRPPRQQLSALDVCFSGGSRLPFARLQMLQTPPQASKATTLTAIQLLLYIHALAICFSGGSRLPFARLQMFQTLPQASKATTLTATCPCHLKATTLTAIHALPSVFQGVQDCRLPAFKCSKRLRRPPRQQLWLNFGAQTPQTSGLVLDQWDQFIFGASHNL